MTVDRDWLNIRNEDGTRIRVCTVSPGIFRICASPDNQFQDPPLMRYGIVSLPECRSADAEAVKSRDSEVLDTEDGSLTADKSGGRLTLLAGNQIPLIDNIGTACTADGFQIHVSLSNDDQLYGLGDLANIPLMRRGRTLSLWLTEKTCYTPVPFLMSSRGWAIYINSTWRHTFDIGQTDPKQLVISGAARDIDFYLFVGDGYASLLDKFTSLIGRPSLLPIWAYGLSFVCNRQSDDRQVVEDALRFRQSDIPCDMIGLEPGWMSRQHDFTTAKEWHPERFYIPEWTKKGPDTFIGTLASFGFKLSLWLCCDYDLSLQEELEVSSNHSPATVGEAPEDDAVHEAWFTHLERFVDQGVEAFKLAGDNQTHEHPDRRWANGMMDEEMHNLYPLLLSKQMYQGFFRKTGRRPMIYSIAGYTGIQQYAAIYSKVSDDHSAPNSLINHSLVGSAHFTSDMDIHSKAGIHFGFFQPWCKVNSWAYWRHPCFLEPRKLRIFKMYANLRYSLLPYIYTAAHKAAHSGLPIVRPMLLAFEGDDSARDLTDQYMFGDSLLVGVYTDQVYLPSGVWYDYWTRERHIGPKHLTCRIEEPAGGPLFVRGGAILPMWPKVDYIGQQIVEQLSLHIYPHETGEYTLYEDDGLTLGYQRAEICRTHIVCNQDESGTSVHILRRTGDYTGKPERRAYHIYLYDQHKPVSVVANGTRCQETNKYGKSVAHPVQQWKYSKAKQLVEIVVEENKDQESLHIEFRCTTAERSKHGDSKRKTYTENAEPGETETRMPHQPEQQPMSTRVHPVIEQLKSIVNDELHNELTLAVLSDRVHMHRSHLSRLFTQEVGQSFSSYVLEKRMTLARHLLTAGDTKVEEVAEATGFKDASYFIKVFRKFWGITPGQLNK